MKRFQRKKEDFVCEHCGTRVVGNGYTNHCPECLYSKHVDVMPGDRLAECQGIMVPLRIEVREGHERIVHQCVVCGHQKINKTNKEDRRTVLVELARKNALENF